ncbi:MAG: carbon monoxide dehydrogenase subunit G [Quisquiliibacterium sp.]
MELNSQQVLRVTRQQAWDALNDLEILRRAIPGCETISPDGENNFQVVVAAAVGPVKARFRSKLQLQDIDAPNSYTMQFDGQGGAAGFGKGTAKVRLEPGEPGLTVLHYQVTAQVGGKLAQVGSRLVDMAAQKMARDFFEKFDLVLLEVYPPAEQPAAQDKPPAKPAGLFARLRAALGRLFGR